jgi:hypothetical protein
MKTYDGVEVWLHTFLTSALGKERLRFTFRPLYPKDRHLITKFLVGFVDPKTGLNFV